MHKLDVLGVVYKMSFKEKLQTLPTLLLFMSAILSTSFLVDGQFDFTQEPEKIVYVSIGNDVTFHWNYTVNNRNSTFGPSSPIWSFFEENGTEHKIGQESKKDGWKWSIVNSSCPPRLLRPTLRVLKTSPANLVILKPTRADEGTYGCTLTFFSSPAKTSKAKLVVTSPPQITITGERSVLENTNVNLNCSAVGPPTPNVTWINSADVVLEQGIQSALLIITNITQGQNGTIYKCIATNNPNELPVQKVIVVTVKSLDKNDPGRGSNQEGLSTGEIVGIVVGVIFAVVIIIVIIVLVCRKKKGKKHSTENTE